MVPGSPTLILLSFAAAGAGVALVLAQRRSRRASAAAKARCEALVAVQDTLLQRFTGITLQIDGVRNSLRQQSNPSADDLARILDQADQILREARELIRPAP